MIWDTVFLLAAISSLLSRGQTGEGCVLYAPLP
jgi:hypothetical protein